MNMKRLRRRSLTMAIACATLLSAAAQADGFSVVYKVSGIKPPQPLEEPSNFKAHTFTTCGATLGTGPSLAACKSAYAATDWVADPGKFSVLHDGTPAQGIQVWTVPATGTYRIEAAGASRTPTYNNAEGRGAVISGDFSLQKGHRLLVLVGQHHPSFPYHGVGGTFVVAEDGLSPLMVAGGAGGLSGYGTNRFCSTSDASFTPSGRSGCGTGTTSGGSNGLAGVSGVGIAGAGIKGDSNTGNQNARAYSFMTVYNGGQNQSQAFGGGGTYVNNNGVSSGGGGGYSGGGVGENGGGGGGSYNTGNNPVQVGYNPIGNSGYVSITRL